MSVQRFLITGSDRQLVNFSLSVCSFANWIERRGDTVFYTVFAEDVARLMNAAEVEDLTVQQRSDGEQKPFWPVVRQGKAEAWKP